ncbi:MAG: LamG domain-containing protein [Candidatus Latescibacteria bacterium]|nr:LamG domain-containing protein [Candidatus Latescibacterota bacterium]
MNSLIAHWPLKGNAGDRTGRHPGAAHDVGYVEGPSPGTGAVRFGPGRSRIEVPTSPGLMLGSRDFTVSAWVRCPAVMRGNFGEILGKFHGPARCGFTLCVAGSSPGYNAMCDTRHVHFGIDDAYLGPWQDYGRPWPSNGLVSDLAVYEGSLYAGISDASDPRDAARVFRWAGGTEWEDCGRLGSDPGHLSVQSMLVHAGRLYAGTGVWDWVRSAGKDGFAPAPSHVFVHEGGRRWRDLGQVGESVRVLTLASFDGFLYAGLDRVGGGHVFRMEGDRWVDCGSLNGDNVENLMPMDGALHGATHTRIYRLEGEGGWRLLGDRPHSITQIHSMRAYGGRLHIGTWPHAYVLRHEGNTDWARVGCLGLPLGPGTPLINEVNDLTVHNGKLYAGVLPKSQVYRFEKDDQWTLLGSLATRPDWSQDRLPSWGRVSCMASFQGRLMAGTGVCQARSIDCDPEGNHGRVLACQAGLMASHEKDIGADWTHVAGVREGRDLRLYLNGRLAATARGPDRTTFDLGNPEPLLLGNGPQGPFSGDLGDVRLYDGALGDPEIVELHAARGVDRTG